MATTAAMAIRDSEARARLNRALSRLATRLGVEESAPAPDAIPVRDPAMKAIREVERLADRIEALDAALKDEGYSAAPGSAGKVEPDPASEIPGTVEEGAGGFAPLPELDGDDVTTEFLESAPDTSAPAPRGTKKGKGRSS